MNDSDDEIRLARLRDHAKRELRTRMRSVRAVLPLSARQARSSAAIARVLALPEYERARTIAAFSAIQKELDPAALLEHARAHGKRVALPRVAGEELTMHVVESTSELEEGAFGIPEPLETAPLVDPAEIDLVLVPGLAFDERGHRIGYGRAFYDRLLPKMPQAFRIGLAYDFQLLAELPNEAHDIAMQCVVSDLHCVRVETEA